MTVKTGIIYLQKDKFQFYSPYIRSILEFRFVPEIVQDLDIINAELLENLIKVFVANNKIVPSNLVFVLAESAYFIKDFVNPVTHKNPTVASPLLITKELLLKQADEFIEHVPFDNVVSKTIPIKDGLKVCATNKDFYESVAIAFEHLGFTVESVVPGLVLGNGLSLRPVLDLAMATMILQKINAVRQYNLLGQQVFQPQVKQEMEEVDEVEIERLQTKKSDKKRFYALGGVFISLIFVLVIVYVQSQTPPTPPKQPALANTSNPTPQVANPVVLATIIPTVTGSTSASTLQTQNLTIQIVDTLNSPSVAQNLLGRLDTYKFKSVNLQTASSIGSSGTLVSFSSGISQDVRNIVLEEVKKYVQNVIVQEKQIGTYNITIVLGQ
ncbi:MAG TPA: hypothetical protein VNW29_05575 [Candidatus Sulfotelmatobacter sp.]|jgi:hypothetical protein|nr:hypothetical protein [Candidatus Sulfotelmatobacter sp.]